MSILSILNDQSDHEMDHHPKPMASANSSSGPPSREGLHATDHLEKDSAAKIAAKALALLSFKPTH